MSRNLLENLSLRHDSTARLEQLMNDYIEYALVEVDPGHLPGGLKPSPAFPSAWPGSRMTGAGLYSESAFSDRKGFSTQTPE
jgi:hypothetical protein